MGAQGEGPILPPASRGSACISCGSCSGRCHLAGVVEGMNPRAMVRLASLRDEPPIHTSGFLWSCTLCARCTEDCPAGVRMDIVTRTLRGRLARAGGAPAELLEGIAVALETGNNSRIGKDDFIDTLQWIGEELIVEAGGQATELPVDRVGARVLFVPNPREILYLPMLLASTARVLETAGESWTLSTNAYDITNWAYYIWDEAAQRAIARRIVDEARRLGVERILSTECGHGYKILKHDAREWFGDDHRFEVASLAETIDGYLASGRIELDPGKHAGKVFTYHDPCNLARKSGIVEEPRRVLAAAVGTFVDMQPNGRHNWCCGGGGGTGQIKSQTPVRALAGRRKVDQIRATGASVVVTSCQNCYQQLNDLAKEHKLAVEVKTLAEIVSAALV